MSDLLNRNVRVQPEGQAHRAHRRVPDPGRKMVSPELRMKMLASAAEVDLALKQDEA
jgi:hypothetical protein